MVHHSSLSLKKNSRYITPIISHTAYSRHLSSRSETKSFNGRTRTVILVSVRPRQNSSRLKSSNTDDFNSNSTYRLNKSNSNPRSAEQDTTGHSSKFDESSWIQQSYSQNNGFTSSSIFDNKNQTSRSFKDWSSNTKDLLEYSGKKKRRNRRIISVRRCLWLLCCLCATIFLGLIIATALIATLFKSNSTTTTTTTTLDTTTGTITTLTTTTASTITTTNTVFTSITTTSTTQSTTLTTTETTTDITSESTTVTPAVTVSTASTTTPPSTSINISSSTSNFFGYETISISCSVTITNITIQIFVQTTVGATYNAVSNSFSTGVISQTHGTAAGQIVYTWTIVPGQTVACAAATYNVKAQFNLSGTAQPISGDTYVITVVTSAGVTTTFTGHF